MGATRLQGRDPALLHRGAASAWEAAELQKGMKGGGTVVVVFSLAVSEDGLWQPLD